MQSIEFNDTSKMGYYLVDREHEMFVLIINRIVNAIKNDGFHEYVESMVDELIKYAEFHFISEENIMVEMKYPDIVPHKKEHDDLLAKLRDRIFSRDYEFINLDYLIDYIKVWFSEHTEKFDKKLMQFIKQEKDIRMDPESE